jgi:hypothetical protein
MPIPLSTLPIYKKIPLPNIQKAQNIYLASLDKSISTSPESNRSSKTSLSDFHDCISHYEEPIIYNHKEQEDCEDCEKHDYTDTPIDRNNNNYNEVTIKQLETISINNSVIQEQTRTMNDIIAKIQEYNTHLQSQMYSYTYNNNIIQQQLETIKLQNDEIDKNAQELEIQNQSIQNFNTFIQSTCSTYNLDNQYYS